MFRRRSCRFRVALIVAALGATAAGAVVASPAAADEDGLRLETHSTFRVDPTASAVHVDVEITVTNETPNQTSGGLVRQFYFDRISYPLWEEATNLTASRSDGRSLSVTRSVEGETIAVATIDLSPDIFYRDTQRLRFSYDLPNLPPRSAGLTRVTDAFASFVVFTVADPGLASVTVAVPDTYDVETIGPPLGRSVDGGVITLTQTQIADPLSWTVGISARNDSKLGRRTLKVDGHAIEVRAWPDDTEWSDFVAEHTQDGLPELVDLIGQPYPVKRELDILETVSPYLYGYSGWYLPIENAIEIGDDLDPRVILHELAHLWFNADLFTERWSNEAFAEEYATRVLHELGEPLARPDKVEFDSEAAVSLDAWSDPQPQDDLTVERELYGYNASWAVVRRVSNEIGMGAMADVIDAVSARDLPYRGDRAPERVFGVADSRRLLDLFEEVGGSASARELFEAYVFQDSVSHRLRARDTAREAYATLVEAGREWAAPYVVRDAMGRWDFGLAGRLMDQATAVLEVRAKIHATLEPFDIDLPKALEESYEYREAELDEVERAARAYLDAAEAIARAENGVGGNHGIFGSIGLWGSDSKGKLGDATRSFEHGNAAAAERQANAATAVVEGASRAGKIRLALLAVAIAALACLRIAFRAVSRRRRARVAATSESAGDGGEADSALHLEDQPSDL